MPILVDDPRAGIGKGIASAAKSISGAVSGIAKDYQSEQKELEKEQRAIEQRKDLGVLQAKERSDERDAVYEDQKKKNQERSEAVAGVLRDHIQNKEAGNPTSELDLMTKIQGISAETGIPFDKLMNDVNQYMTMEERVSKRQTREEVNLARASEREESSREEIMKRYPHLKGQDLEDALELSRKHENIHDPQKRFTAFNKDYQKQVTALKSFKDTLEGPSFRERAFGMSDKHMKNIQSTIKNLKNLGVREEKIEDILATVNLEGLEIEQVFSPLSSREKSAIDKIPKAEKTINLGDAEPFSTEITGPTRNRLLQKLPDLIVSAIQDGGSLKLVAERLVKKGYKREEIQNALVDVMDKVDLSPRQRRMAQEVTQKPKTRTLGQIFTFGN